MIGRVALAVPLLIFGAIGGFAGAAAVMRRWLSSTGDESSDEVSLVAIFDGVELASSSTAFRGGTVLAWFGGVDLDLSGATLAPGARLEIRAVMGGVRVTVPPSCRVESDATAFLGGIDVARSGSDDAAAPTLAVSGLSVMGGVAVTH